MRETQYEIVLNMLRRGSVTTRDIFEQWINCPPKVIEGLRKKGYKILTEPIEGKNYLFLQPSRADCFKTRGNIDK